MGFSPIVRLNKVIPFWLEIPKLWKQIQKLFRVNVNDTRLTFGNECVHGARK